MVSQLSCIWASCSPTCLQRLHMVLREEFFRGLGEWSRADFVWLRRKRLRIMLASTIYCILISVTAMPGASVSRLHQRRQLMSTTTCFLCTDRGARHRTVFGENAMCRYRSPFVHLAIIANIVNNNTNICSRCRFSLCNNLILCFVAAEAFMGTHGRHVEQRFHTNIVPATHERARALRPRHAAHHVDLVEHLPSQYRPAPSTRLHAVHLTTQCKARRGFFADVTVSLCLSSCGRY